MNRPVALITGASSGIGWHLAKRLGQEGYALALLARREEQLAKLSEELSADGVPVFHASCDVTDLAAIQQALERCEKELGPVDLLIANAGLAANLPVKRFDPLKARQVYEVNVIGLMQSIAAVLPKMLERRKGHIVGISSLASYLSFPRNYIYCASKAAVNAQLDGLRLELRPYGIHVTTICPGFIETPMTQDVKFPMPFLMPVDRAVDRMVYAIKQKKARYNFPIPLYWMVRLAAFLPDGLRARLSG